MNSCNIDHVVWPDTQLGLAASICAEHAECRNGVTANSTSVEALDPTFPAAFKACTVVWRFWLQSREEERQRQTALHKERETLSSAFIDEVARGLLR